MFIEMVGLIYISTLCPEKS